MKKQRFKIGDLVRCTRDVPLLANSPFVNDIGIILEECEKINMRLPGIRLKVLWININQVLEEYFDNLEKIS